MVLPPVMCCRCTDALHTCPTNVVCCINIKTKPANIQTAMVGTLGLRHYRSRMIAFPNGYSELTEELNRHEL
eukprot:m.40093 g.40093  ORF g.40093 m.40093 type:complete len:72 (+) comp5913_c0_seq2:81-296(+)